MNKVVFISHGHPELSKGGAEIASWNLYQFLKSEGIECLYIARADTKSHGGSAFSQRGEEILFHTGIHDWFNLTTNSTKQLFGDLNSLLADFKPDIVHVHHFAHMGIEIFSAIKRAVPQANLVFTLHEFMAMCMHNGQMVKKDTLKLCNKAIYADCHKCFPQHSPGDFFLRKQFLLDQFCYVDAFVSPSQFLADRYVEWGISESKMKVIENVLPKIEPIPPRTLHGGEKRIRFAFFGQINPYKGLDLLLKAILLLPDHIKREIRLDVHGANLDLQESEFKDKVTLLLDQLSGIVHLRGQYESEQLPSRMAECDWVIIPSIWWENSPVVIQEAIRFGRPLIGANIGGMKEKIEGKAGLTFEARSASSLAERIVQATEPEVFDYWHGELSHYTCAESAHLAFLRSLTA
ncbi:glycosyltransferase [Alteromonas oceanisediminis]|uniref:glycosyltransferase n=1 Tax=Alteromonas oceanisediminis TaxID=2836180 RepID=UPI001BDA36D6|nr:glycosyltransferase [Alteromonas oceanisediminis]MBT0585035.1 glycosyltransferase [Alteromonas oceanisediminis]